MAELAGIPLPAEHGEAVDGVSLVPWFEDPTREIPPTTAGQGTRNKTLAFSQYPHTDKGPLCPATQCPFYKDGICHAAPLRTNASGRQDQWMGDQQWMGGREWMGFSVRNQQWRYTVWVPFNGTRAQWSQSTIEELYNHSYGLDVTSMDAMDETVNLAYEPEHAALAALLLEAARAFFEVEVPPTAPATPTPAPACASWCTKKRPPKQYCKFVDCKRCPKCL